MKIKMPKIKISSRLLSPKYIYIFIFLLTATVLLILGFFLYKNFYRTITQSEQIILLKKEVAPETINLQKVEQVLNNLDAKATTTESVNWDTINNPFKSITPVPESIATTTKK